MCLDVLHEEAPGPKETRFHTWLYLGHVEGRAARRSVIVKVKQVALRQVRQQPQQRAQVLVRARHCVRAQRRRSRHRHLETGWGKDCDEVASQDPAAALRCMWRHLSAASSMRCCTAHTLLSKPAHCRCLTQLQLLVWECPCLEHSSNRTTSKVMWIQREETAHLRGWRPPGGIIGNVYGMQSSQEEAPGPGCRRSRAAAGAEPTRTASPPGQAAHPPVCKAFRHAAGHLLSSHLPGRGSLVMQAGWLNHTLPKPGVRRSPSFLDGIKSQ